MRKHGVHGYVRFLNMMRNPFSLLGRYCSPGNPERAVYLRPFTRRRQDGSRALHRPHGKRRTSRILVYDSCSYGTSTIENPEAYMRLLTRCRPRDDLLNQRHTQASISRRGLVADMPKDAPGAPGEQTGRPDSKKSGRGFVAGPRVGLSTDARSQRSLHN